MGAMKGAIKKQAIVIIIKVLSGHKTPCHLLYVILSKKKEFDSVTLGQIEAGTYHRCHRAKMGYTLNKFITGLTHRDKPTHIYTNILFRVTSEPRLLAFDIWRKPENTARKPAQV